MTTNNAASHTPEPWRTDGDDIYGNGSHGDVAMMYLYENGIHKANARRIVACVNACTGILTDGLEKYGGIAIVNGNTLVLGDRLKNVEKQRDDLLAALEGMIEVFGDEFGMGDSEIVDKARAAIANANGGA